MIITHAQDETGLQGNNDEWWQEQRQSGGTPCRLPDMRKSPVEERTAQLPPRPAYERHFDSITRNHRYALTRGPRLCKRG